MDKFLKSCRRCLNLWVIGLIVMAVIGLFIFVPILGAVSLVAILPLLGCTLMCGVMALFMKGHKKDQ